MPVDSIASAGVKQSGNIYDKNGMYGYELSMGFEGRMTILEIMRSKLIMLIMWH